MPIRIPEPLRAEHHELHAELAEATRAGGRTGEAAKAVARLMHAHFEKEEEYALPPLGLLPDLAGGKVEPAMAAVLKMTDRLEADLPAMLAEHRDIVTALGKLIDAANAEGKPAYVRFAEKLMAHARTEEDVSYPTALLIGRFVRAGLTGEKAKAA